MKLLLTSGGLRTDTLLREFERLVGKSASEVNVAIIDEASAVEAGDKRWKVDELAMIAKRIGGKIDFVDLLALSLDEAKERLLLADAMYVLGGNPDYLMRTFKKTGFAELLTSDFFSEKVYVGSSAGSMVVTERANTKGYLNVYAKSNTFEVESYMGLVNIIFRPHMTSSDNKKYQYETLAEVAVGLQNDLYGLRDDQALSIVDGKLTVVGGDVFYRKGSEG